VRAGTVPCAGERRTDVPLGLSRGAHDLVEHAAGTPAPAQHHSVGVPLHPVQDLGVASHARSFHLRGNGDKEARMNIGQTAPGPRADRWGSVAPWAPELRTAEDVCRSRREKGRRLLSAECRTAGGQPLPERVRLLTPLISSPEEHRHLSRVAGPASPSLQHVGGLQQQHHPSKIVVSAAHAG
jgi:hypothetical protein